MDLANFHTYTHCEKCGAIAEVNTSLVYTSIQPIYTYTPPKYRYTCPKCGHVGYTADYKLVTTNSDFSWSDEKVNKETADNKLDKVIELLTDIKKLLEE